MEQSLIDKFLKELSAHIQILEKDYENRKKLYDIDKFLSANFSAKDSNTYESLVSLANARCKERGETLSEQNTFESVAVECYELLKFFEPNTSITLDELKEAFFTCSLANKNEVMKKFDRYKTAIDLLNTVKQLFVRHQFRKAENSSGAIENTMFQLTKYRNLHTFLTTGVLEQELENVDAYHIDGSNFSQEEWLEIYNYIVLTIIDSYKKEEESKKEESKAKIEAVLEERAKALEKEIFESLPEETAAIIKPVGRVVEPEAAVAEPVQGGVEPEKELVYLSDETLVNKYNDLELKINEHRKLGKISLTRTQSFGVLYESLSNGNTLENVRAIYYNSDYLKFLYYCFKKEFEKIRLDFETQYPKEDVEDYTQLLLLDINKPLIYLNELESILEKEREEQISLNHETPSVSTEIQGDEKPYKLIFYGDGGADILKDIKKFTPEKKREFVEILTKMEDGKLDRCIVINRYVPVPFRAIRGDNVFVAFRMLNDGHLLVVTTSNLSDLNTNLFRLNNYNLTIEKNLVSIIRNGSFEYKKLMTEHEEVKSNIFNQGFTKGV